MDEHSFCARHAPSRVCSFSLSLFPLFFCLFEQVPARAPPEGRLPGSALDVGSPIGHGAHDDNGAEENEENEEEEEEPTGGHAQSVSRHFAMRPTP